MQKYELRHVKAKVLELFTKVLGHGKRSKKKKKKENERQKKLAKVQLKLMNGPNDKEKAAKSHKRKHQEIR